LAIGLKVSGVVLVPAVALLIGVFHQRQRAMGIASRRVFRRTCGTVVIAAALYAIAATTRSSAPMWSGGTVTRVEEWTVQPLQAFLNAISFFLSTNKGLLIYCPVTLLSLAWLPRAWREDRLVTSFGVLALTGLVAGFAPLFFFTEETWGPRYLLPTVAPLIVCLAAAVRPAAFRLKKAVPLLVLASWGLFVSFLGIFFEYHSLHVVAITLMGRTLTLEQLQHDSEWNPIRFDTRLLGLWMRGGPRAPDSAAIHWPPDTHVWSGGPAVRPEVSQLDIRPWAVPQPFLFRPGEDRRLGSGLGLWLICLAALIVGTSTLAWVAFKAFRETTISCTEPPGSETAGAARPVPTTSPAE
jgi:hypothetical protein